MVLYNVTVKVQEAIAGNWLQWLVEEHAPAIIKTGCFQSFQVLRLLEVDDSEGPTFAVQYRANNIESYNRYIREFSSHFRQEGHTRWGNQFIAFRSVMEVIHQ